jgi:hypothetical protein
MNLPGAILACPHFDIKIQRILQCNFNKSRHRLIYHIMEEMVEHVRVNLNKELWKIDYATGIAICLGRNMTINNNNNDNSDASHDSDNTTGYNGDITQYLQEKDTCGNN